MKASRLTACFAIALSIMTTSCSRNMSSTTYTDSASGGVVLEGTIVSARAVTIKASDKLEGNGAGILAGGVAGGVAGNSIGGGRGRTAATVGGALAGAVLGAVIQDQLATDEGMEYVVQINKGNSSSYTNKKKEIRENNKKASDVAIETDLKSEMISVVQDDDIIFTTGQKVFVIYSDDRPRLAPRQ